VAAIVVAVIADRTAREFACCRIATGVVSAALSSTAVAVLARFDYAVAALLAGDGSDPSVVREARGFDAVSSDGTADVANGARTELCDA